MKVFVKNILSLFPDYYKFDQKNVLWEIWQNWLNFNLID